MVPARDTAAGVAAGAGTSGETVFRRGAGAGGAARVDPLLRRISGLTRFDKVSCGRWLVATTSFPPAYLSLPSLVHAEWLGAAAGHGRS